MPKKRRFRFVRFMLFLPLLLLAGAAVLFMPKKPAMLPEFSPMPMDTAGYNLIGNLPENLESGGFMAGQNGWIYYSNFADGGKLYMCRENGADMVKITDFPVCNINVLRTSLVFTALERSAFNVFGHHFFSTGTDSEEIHDIDRFSQELNNYYLNDSVIFGGKLYAVYGINSPSNPRFCVIDPNVTYFSPYLDRDGLYAAYAEGMRNGLANKFYNAKVTVTREKEYIVKNFSHGSTIYAYLSNESDKKSRIVRIDAKTLLPLDYINGDSLYRVGSGFVFHGEDGYIYEITPSNGEIKPISAVPADNVRMNPFGEIIADTDSGAVIISKEQRYNGIAQALLSRRKSKPITMQNGWYSYYNAVSQYKGANAIYFKANDNYYSISDSGWSADWLNVRLDSEPLVSLDGLIAEDAFTPPWIDFSEGSEPINPASGEDFGSERPARLSTDNRADAAADAQNALDAAILLLSGDESAADKYTGESVEKLRNHYGDGFEAALDEAADKLSANLSSRLEIDITPQEARDILIVWLKNASYEIGGVKTALNGEEAGVALTVKNPVDLNLLYSALGTGDAAGFSHMEILLEPSRYGFISSLSEDVQVYMSMAYTDCWIAESPGKLIRAFIRGFEEVLQ